LGTPIQLSFLLFFCVEEEEVKSLTYSLMTERSVALKRGGEKSVRILESSNFFFIVNGGERREDHELG